jgi:hypothetical protein
VRRLNFVLVVAVGALAMLGSFEAPHADAGGTQGAFAVDCDAQTLGMQTACVHAPGDTFSVAIPIVSAPPAGYFGWQAKLRWSSDAVNYVPASNPASEAEWPDCGVPARRDNRPADLSVLFACVPFPLPSQGISYVGIALILTFECRLTPPSGTDTDIQLSLVSREDDPLQLGTHFIDVNFSPIDPALAGAVVSCVPDIDRDGCLEQQEEGPNPLFGGQRNPRNFWDFFDTPPRDRSITAADIARLVQRFGAFDIGLGAFDRFSDPLSAPNPPVQPAGDRANYHPAFDRSSSPLVMSDVADGIIATGDIALIVRQFGHSCAASL